MPTRISSLDSTKVSFNNITETDTTTILIPGGWLHGKTVILKQIGCDKNRFCTVHTTVVQLSPPTVSQTIISSSRSRRRSAEHVGVNVGVGVGVRDVAASAGKLHKFFL